MVSGFFVSAGSVVVLPIVFAITVVSVSPTNLFEIIPLENLPLIEAAFVNTKRLIRFAVAVTQEYNVLCSSTSHRSVTSNTSW